MAFYAVAKGRVPGVYTTWPSAKAQVDGFKFPKYRKFDTREEAETFIRMHADPRVSSAVTGAAPAQDVATDATALVVFTDGSAIGNGKKDAKAGYAMVWPNHAHMTRGAALEGTPKTNNRAEFMACIDALQAADVIDPTRAETLYVYTDSMLLINTVTQWREGWKKKGWRKSNGDPVMNCDLVQRLDALLTDRTPAVRKVVWRHVEAHTNKDDWESTWNAKVDLLARSSAA